MLPRYSKEGVGELDRATLPQLLELKYQDIRDAVTEFGTIATINKVLIGLKQYLYSQNRAA